jgi:O-antigen/teichoic acid export membrane protein
MRDSRSVSPSHAATMKTTDIFLNWVRLAGINVAVLLCSIVTGIVTARSVDVATLGLFTIIQGIVRLIDGIAGLQSYAALIKTGTSAIGAGKQQEFEGLVKASIVVETGSQLFAFAVALAIFSFAGPWLGLTQEAARWGLIYACGMVLHGTGSPLAILRIFDRFFLGSLGDICGAILRLSATVFCALAKAQPFTFLMSWLAAEVIANLVMIGLAWLELRRRSLGAFLHTKAFGVIRTHKEFWPTIVSANATSTLRLATEHGDVILVGAMFGATAAGYLRIAKTISSAVLQLAWPIHYVLGPTITRYWSAGNYAGLRRLIKTTIAASFGIFIAAFGAFYLLGGLLITSFYGANYAPATGVATVYVFAYAITIVGSLIAPTIYAMGKPLYYTYIHLTCVVAFTIAVYLLLPHFGILTTGIGHVIYQSLWLVMGYLIVFKAIAAAEGASTRSRPDVRESPNRV